MSAVIESIDPIATGKRIRELRKLRGIRVAEICDVLGLSESRAVYYWESGESIPSTQNLLSLSRLLGVPMDEILVTYPTRDPEQKSYRY